MAQEGSTQVPVMQWYASPSLPHFSGDSADGLAEDFVAEVDRVLAAYPMGSEMAAYFIYSHLKGTARREVMLYDLEETNTPEKVNNILLGVFGDGRRITTLMSAFFNRDQQPEETILDYSHAVRSLERSIRRKTPEALTDDLVRDKFIDGLLDPTLRRDLRRMVRRNPQTSFLQARDEALRWMREMEEDQQQQFEDEAKQLKHELLLMKESLDVIQESLSMLVSSRVSQKKRRRGKRKRNKKKHQQLTIGTSSLRGSNPSCSPKQLSPQKTISVEAVRDHHTRLSCDEEEPCWDGWVLLPIPPDPGTRECDRDCQGVSHPKTVAPYSASKPQQPVHFDRGRERKGSGTEISAYGDEIKIDWTPLSLKWKALAAAC